MRCPSGHGRPWAPSLFSVPLLIRLIYLTILSRGPTPAELATAEAYFGTAGLATKQAVDDLAWALVNTKEFLYRH